jgi:glycosyltransferase involved in cell wall biosynthesis
MTIAPIDRPVRLSIVIVNYNYQDYVGAAIDSALAVRWDDVEIIVVDDGSTDRSWEIISRYETVKAQRIDNIGQMGATRVAVSLLTGDVVLFLDSDDTVEPNVMEAAHHLIGPGVSKVQFAMQPIGKSGEKIGTYFPTYPKSCTSDDVARWLRTTSNYPTAPGSANIYARWFVDRIFAMETDYVDRAPDSYLISAAPILGAVRTIPAPLANYRIHGENHGAFSALDATRFARDVTRTIERFDFANDVRRSDGQAPLPFSALEKGIRFNSLRVTSFVLKRDTHPLAADNRLGLIGRTVQSLFYPQGFGPAQHLALVSWSLLNLIIPKSAATRLIELRYVPAARQKLRDRLRRTRS